MVWLSCPNPNVVLNILSYGKDNAESTAVSVADRSKYAAVVDPQAVVDADPEPARVVFKHCGHIQSGQTVGCSNRRELAVAHEIQGPKIADPYCAVACCQHRTGASGGQALAHGIAGHLQVVEIVDAARGDNP